MILPQGLKQIGEMAFLGCAHLTRIVIPGSVQRVGTLAFAKCTALERVRLEPGVAALGPSSFSKCTSLTRVDVPESLAAFGGGVFGAAVGPRPAFILASFLAIAAGILSFGGVDPSTSASVVAFGSFLGPHIAYAGGVAAVAFAKRKGAIENGADVGTPMHLLRDPSVMLVGGLFGVVGCVLEWFFTAICSA